MSCHLCWDNPSLDPPFWQRGVGGIFLPKKTCLKQDVMVMLSINQETSSLVNFKKWVAQEMQGS
jgi:hypothetical protein